MMVHYSRLNQHEKSIASIYFTIRGSQKSVLTTPILERGNFWQKYVKSKIKYHIIIDMMVHYSKIN